MVCFNVFLHLAVCLSLLLSGVLSHDFSCGENNMVGSCSCGTPLEEGVAYELYCGDRDKYNVMAHPEEGVANYHMMEGVANYNVMLKLVPSAALLLTCDGISEMAHILKLLGGLNLGNTPIVKIENCPIPNVPFKHIFNTMGVVGVKYFSFTNANFGNESLLPFHFDNLEEVVHLELFRNHIETLPKDIFANLKKLELLNLNGNMGMEIEPQVFHPLTTLESLDLSGCRLNKLEENAFKNIHNLKFLNLHANLIKEIPEGLFRDLKNVSKLLLSSNRLTKLPNQVFEHMESLEEVTLSFNQFVSLPSGLFSRNKKLKSLNWFVNGNRRCIATNCKSRLKVNLPKDMFLNSSVRSINMAYVAVQKIPHGWLEGCTQLKNLTLRGAHISTLPDHLFDQAKNIQRIDLENNQISEISEKLFQNTKQLKSLRLSRNYLKEITNWDFLHLANIQTLDLSHNKLENISPKAFSNLNTLDFLDMSFNHIHYQNFEIPAGKNLHKLKKLDLSGNFLTDIQNNWTQNLLHIKVLNMSGNHFGPEFDFASLSLPMTPDSPLLIDLSNNNIERLTVANISANNESPRHPISLHISANPIICDCFSSILKETMAPQAEAEAYKGPLRIDPANVVCGSKSPAHLIGAYLSDVPFSQLNCQIPHCLTLNCQIPQKSDKIMSKRSDSPSAGLPSTCPPGCLCLLNQHFSSLNINCSSSKTMAHHLPSQFPFLPKLTNSLTINMGHQQLYQLNQGDHKWKTTTQEGKNLIQVELSQNVEEMFLESGQGGLTRQTATKIITMLCFTHLVWSIFYNK